MKQFISLLTLAGMIVTATPALARSIDQLDKPINLTARVIDGSVYPEIDRVQTDSNTKQYFENQAKRNKQAVQAHCINFRSFHAQSTTECGAGFQR